MAKRKAKASLIGRQPKRTLRSQRVMEDGSQQCGTDNCRDNVQNAQDTPDVQNAEDTPGVQNAEDTLLSTPNMQSNVDDEYERNRESFRSALAAMDQDISNCITLSEKISQIVSEMGNDHTTDVGINQRFLSC